MMKVFAFNFEGDWLNGSAVVIAESAAEARTLLLERAKQHGFGDVGRTKWREIDAMTRGVPVFEAGEF